MATQGAARLLVGAGLAASNGPGTPVSGVGNNEFGSTLQLDGQSGDRCRFMARLVTAAVAGATVLSLAGCTDGARQVPTPTADRSASTLPSTSLSPTTASPTTPTATSGGKGGSGGGGTGGRSGGSGGGAGGGGNNGASGGHGGSTAPAFQSASVQCVVTGHESVPGRGDVATYSPRVTWTATGATAVAVSVDNPGGVGTYGTFGASGSIDLGDGCYTDQNSHTIVLQTVGGNGSPATRTLHTPANRSHPQPVTDSLPPSSASSDASPPSGGN